MAQGICESVEALATALAAHVRRVPLKDPRLVVYLAEIGTMPMYRDMGGGLDGWEESVARHPIDREVRQRTREPLSALAEEIFQLGCRNLHVSIKPAETKAEFERVRALLMQEGVSDVPPSSAFDFRVW
jgi:hypothetical protein